ncbi:centrosome-associated protein 350 [Carassius gibelio]|uniref:centrosome-associated protein 350 n=1 Tax=Carassius gibelio TaxID=101364 RepID=UPI00227928FC|nr:centrosome-associated protein 350 [Carassius gibelio]
MPVMNRSGLLGKVGLRRLLSSDEVWTLGRKRNQVEFVPVEQDILQVTESNNPPASPSHRYSRQNQASLHLISSERISKTECGSTSCQRDSVKALKSGPEVNEQDTQNKVQGLYEDTCTLKRERPHHPAELPMKPVLHIQHFTLNREPHSDSLPIKDDLRLDSKKRPLKIKEQEDIKMTNVVHGSSTPDTTSLNIQNNQRLHSVLTLNNNHNICDRDVSGQWRSSLSYSKTDKTNEFPEQKSQACINETVTDNPLIENLILEAVSVEIRKAEDSPSCDVSLSEIDEKSEAISFHSDALAWSEEERECLDEEKIEAAQANSCSLIFAEKYTGVPDDLNNKQEGRCTLPRYERQATAESTLSEILSPVDEVLSYGSAELPPSVKGGVTLGLDSYGCPPPPPAFEIITWTSEEELQAPPDSVEDLSINSENLPPLPVDFSLRRKESQSLDSNSVREKEVNDDTNGALCEDPEESDCSEYTFSLPEDARNEISDPLSFFQIGDRVLVCNSRPGVLKYKGLTAFANGFWAGVALDAPIGNHNGTFRGVKYFSCEKSHGVLVRAEDITHIHREHRSDVETGVDEDLFSDEEQPRARRDKQQKVTLSADGQRGHLHSQCPPRDETILTNATPQEDMSDGARNLSHAFEMSSPRTDFELHHNELHQNRHHEDAKLTEELDKDGVHCAQDNRKRQRIKALRDNHSTDTEVRKGDDGHLMPCVLDQWHQAQPDTPPKIKVPPHEDGIVYRLVDTAVEILCGQTNEDTLDLYETPSYLLDDDSRKRYRQVIFQLTSDVLHEIWGDLLRTKQPAQNIDDQSVISALQSSQISITFLKAAVRKEIQKILNLERNEQQMTELLQKLCKYWYAKRDRVDFILIQELHNEERTWLDYSADQYTVKMHLTEEIFSLLLDDTILALNHMHFST